MFKFLAPVFLMMLAGPAGAVNQAYELNDLRLTNRAQCAVDSDSPTKSVFFILDGYNAGRVSFAVATNLGQNADAFAEHGMREFRLSVAGLQNEIFQKLISGLLPLIPHNTSNQVKSKLSTYQSLIQQCNQDTFCPQLQDYFQKIWSASESSQGTADVLNKIRSLDRFEAGMFLPKGKVGASCFFLKKFSPLQAQLHTADLNIGQINSLVDAVQHSDQYIGSCFDESDSSRNVALQVDVKADDAVWARYGFDFWNSFRLYLSWAWRFSTKTQNFSPQFYRLFKSVNLEESVMMIPNGCKSITPPQCTGEELSTDAIRELAKPPGQENEFDQYVPKGPQRELLAKGARSVNNDLLSTLAYDKASGWVENFRKQYVEQRWIVKNKLYNATHFLTLLSSAYSASDLVESIKPYVLAPNVSSALRDETAYMCLEWRLAGDKKLDFLSSDIDRVSQLDVMMKAQSQYGLPLQQQVGYFKALSQALGPLCNQLEKSRFFNQPDYVTNWTGLEKWAQEMTTKSMTKIEGPFFTPMTLPTGAFVTFGSESTPLCLNPLDCARKVLKSAVDLYNVSTYADAFFQTRREVKAPHVFNPYAELKACKVYDPWFQTKRTQKVFLADLASTALFGWNPLPIYLDVDWSAPRVTSFNTLLKNGQLKFDPKIQKGEMQKALLADFGPLLGAPCAVQIAPNSDKNFNFYAFNGISVNYCKVNQGQNFEGSNPNEVKVQDPKASSYCGGCTINFVGVASAASAGQMVSGFNPFKFGIYLFRSVYKFLTGYKDAVNVPRTYNVSIPKVMETFERYHGQIPETCVQALGQGMSCYQNTCASRAALIVEKKLGVKISSVFESDTLSGNEAKTYLIRVPGCNYDVAIDAYCTGDDEKDFRVNEGSLFIPRACKNLKVVGR